MKPDIPEIMMIAGLTVLIALAAVKSHAGKQSALPVQATVLPPSYAGEDLPYYGPKGLITDMIDHDADDLGANYDVWMTSTTMEVHYK